MITLIYRRKQNLRTHIFPSPIQVPARLSSSLNQPPTPTKTAIAVREIVRSTAQKNRAGVTALPVSGRHARRFIRGRNRVSAVCTEAVPSFFPAARCAAVSARITRSAAKALEKIFPERVWRKFFWNCRHRARTISIW